MTTNSKSPPKLAYSINETRHATSLGRTTIYSHISSGRLKTKKIGGRVVILADSLRSFLANDDA